MRELIKSRVMRIFAGFLLLPLIAFFLCSCSGNGGDAGDSAVDMDADLEADNEIDMPAELIDMADEDMGIEGDGGEGEEELSPFCGDGVCDGDETRQSCPEDCPACDYSRPPTDAPLMLFYAYFDDGDYMPTSINDTLFDPPLPNIETVFHVSAVNFVAHETSGAGNSEECTPPYGEFARFREAGAKLAKHIIAKRDLMCSLTGHPFAYNNPDICNSNGECEPGRRESCLNCPHDCGDCCEGRLGWNRCHGPEATAEPGAECAAEVLVEQLKNGYDYISIDEFYENVLSQDHTFPDGVTYQDLSWNNGHMASERFIELLRLLSLAGYDNRVLIWVEYHTVQIGADGSSNGRLWDLKNIWDACHDDVNNTHCRKIFFEVYGNEAACLTTSKVLGDGTHTNLDDLAERLNRLGIGDISTVGLGVTPEYLDGYNRNHACDLAPDHLLTCPDATLNRGGLRLIFGRMHNHTEWRGVGFYTLARAEASGPWSLPDLAESIRGYIKWWDTYPE